MAPDVGVSILAGALGIEAVGLGDATRFMVSTDQVDAVGVAEFEANEQGDGLNAEETAVDIVAYKALADAIPAASGASSYQEKDNSYQDKSPRS